MGFDVLGVVGRF